MTVGRAPQICQDLAFSRDSLCYKVASSACNKRYDVVRVQTSPLFVLHRTSIDIRDDYYANNAGVSRCNHCKSRFCHTMKPHEASLPIA